MKGTVGIRGLVIECVVGVHAHERTQVQPIVVDLDLECDIEAAAETQALADAADYERAVALVSELARDGRYRLLEALARDAARTLLAELAAVSAVTIEIRKPQALAGAAHAFVRLRIGR